MKLIKEEKINFSGEIAYTKEYDLNGNLIVFNELNHSRIYIYDNKQRVSKERLDNGFKDLWYIKQYEYNPLGYRMSEFKYKSIDEAFTIREFDKEFTLSNNNLNKIEKNIVRHEDVIISNENIISKKETNYHNNKINVTEYEYINELITLKVIYNINKNKKTLLHKVEFKYDTRKRISVKKTTDLDVDNNSEIIEYSYINNTVIETKYDIDRIDIDYQIEITYDEKGNIIRKDGMFFSYIREFNQILKKSFLKAIVEIGYEETEREAGVESMTFFQYAEDKFETKYSIPNQKKTSK